MFRFSPSINARSPARGYETTPTRPILSKQCVLPAQFLVVVRIASFSTTLNFSSFPKSPMTHSVLAHSVKLHVISSMSLKLKIMYVVLSKQNNICIYNMYVIFIWMVDNSVCFIVLPSYHIQTNHLLGCYLLFYFLEYRNMDADVSNLLVGVHSRSHTQTPRCQSMVRNVLYKRWYQRAIWRIISMRY